MVSLALIGMIVGSLSGFFGIGGGTLLVPMLLVLGYDIKIAIGISVTQMLFSSLYGSYLNNKRGTLDVAMVLFIGLGGFVGAMLSGMITASVSNKTLEIVFLSFALFALLRLFLHTKESHEPRVVHKVWLLLIGLMIGVFSMSIGVGGSIILVPILVGFFHIPLKKAISSGLFFVIFSSVAGFISHAFAGNIDYKSGIIIGLASLVGVSIGIHFKEKVATEMQKRVLLLFYLMIVIYLTKRVFF